PDAGTGAVGSSLATQLDVATGSSLTLSAGGGQVDVDTTTSPGAPWPTAIVVSTDTLRELDPDAGVVQVWAQVEDLPSAGLQTLASTITGETGLRAEVGPAMERAMVDEIITTMLGIVLALLAVAIDISVIGGANTIALTVTERYRA